MKQKRKGSGVRGDGSARGLAVGWPLPLSRELRAVGKGLPPSPALCVCAGRGCGPRGDALPCVWAWRDGAAPHASWGWELGGGGALPPPVIPGVCACGGEKRGKSWLPPLRVLSGPALTLPGVWRDSAAPVFSPRC